VTSAYIHRLFALIIVGVMLLSCRKEPQEIPVIPEPEVSGTMNAWLSVKVNVLSSGASTKVSSDIVGGENGSVDENEIKRLAIYLVPAGGGVEDWSKCLLTYVPDVTLSGSTYVGAVKTRLNVPMKVYVGANISTQVASAFLEDGVDAVYKYKYDSPSLSYPDLIGEFASADMGVAMFCHEAGDIIFKSENVNKTTPAIIDKNADSVEDAMDLVRMVSKVHLLFQCYDPPNDGFVKITEPGSLSEADYGEFGWSKLEDISFIVNTVNRRTKVMQTGSEDPNHIMTDLLVKGLEWDYQAGKAKEFIGFGEDLYDDHDDAWEEWSAEPEKFDESRAPFGSGTPYVNGLYCTENTTDGSSLALMTDDEKKYVPFMVATHVIVKARFVPRKINTVVDGVFTIVDHGPNGYDAALLALPQVSGEDENNQPHTYPAGTFFTRDMKEFYDYAGMVKFIEMGTVPGLTRKNFAAYPGGYGFYYSYVCGGNDVTTGQVTFDSSNSGLLRNNYYFLKCSLMKVPAVPGSFNQLMMVNSKVVDWNPKGALNLIVKPNV